jgi:serine/threonine protein kinase
MYSQVDYTGQRLGNYRLVRLLGQGGFAEVYLGEHVHLKTQAAVKLLHTRLSSNDIDGFRTEAQTIARLVHPHIVRVLDFGVEGNAPYLVMDYAPHGTLRNRHSKGSRVALLLVVHYIKQVADALYYAHSQRLIHRDIKPENMLIGRNDEILLSDFGIALASQSSSYQSTQNVAGTIPYMAPEQIQAHPRPASDQYSLGIVAYEWLSGYRPFQGTYTEIAVKHTMVPPPPLRSQVPDLPPAVEAVVMRALHKDSAQRFADVRQFAAALEQASFSGGMRTSTGATQSYLPEPTPAPMSMYPLYQPPSSDAHLSYSPPQPAMLPFGAQPYSNYPPQQAFPPAAPGTFSAPSAAKPGRFSRRALLGGALAAAAGGGIAWYAISHHLFSTSSLSMTGITGAGTGSPISNQLTPTSSTALVTYTGHSDFIFAIAWSPDGKYIVSGSQDGTAQVWDARTGVKLLSTRSHLTPARSDNYAWAVAWSPTSKQIVVGFTDGTAEVIDIVSRNRIVTFGNPSVPAQAVAWSPNGRYVAVGRTDDTVVVYDATSGNALLTYNGHNDFVLALAWSHDSKRIVSGSADSTAQVWRVSDGQTLLKYTGHTDNVRSVSWSPDDTLIVSGALDGTARVWDSASGHTQTIYNKLTGGIVNATSWSHHSVRIAAGGNDATTHIFDANTGNLLKTLPTVSIFGASWSPDDSRLVTADADKTARVWSTS